MLSEKTGWIWFDGHFVPWQDAKIHVLTHGLHYGSAVFEGMRAYKSKIFKLEAHIKRLFRSAQAIGLKVPYTLEEVVKASNESLLRNSLQDAYLRPVIWCGSENLGVASHRISSHIAVAAWSWDVYVDADKAAGLRLMWSDWVRPAPNMAPGTSKVAGLYVIGTLSKNKAEQLGFHDAILLDYRGYVAECSGANIFMVKNGILKTPIADCFLNGITRQAVIEIAHKHAIPLIEAHISPEELLQADEVFITGTAVEVQPVGRIDDQIFSIGPVTQHIQEIYTKLVNT